MLDDSQPVHSIETDHTTNNNELAPQKRKCNHERWQPSRPPINSAPCLQHYRPYHVNTRCATIEMVNALLAYGQPPRSRATGTSTLCVRWLALWIVFLGHLDVERPRQVGEKHGHVRMVPAIQTLARSQGSSVEALRLLYVPFPGLQEEEEEEDEDAEEEEEEQRTSLHTINEGC